MSLATLRTGQRLRGLVPGQSVTLIAAAESLRIDYAALYDLMVAVSSAQFDFDENEE